MNHTTRSRGFTLVELLVVIAIIGILVGLLLPAIQSSRELARSASCQNNLLQLSLALNNYENSYGHYPSGSINTTGPISNSAAGYHHNWLAALLPFCEQQALAAHLDRSKSVYDPANLPVRTFEISFLNCPSDISQGPYSHYAACHNDTESPIDSNNNGVFVLNKVIKRRDISDGLGYTLFIGEKQPDRWELGWISGTRATLRNTGTKLQPLSRDDRKVKVYFSPNPPSTGPGMTSDNSGFDPFMMPPFRDAVEAEDPETSPVAPEPDGYYPNENYIPAFSGVPVNSTSPLSPASALYVGGFGSSHPGYANLCFGDGSIRRISFAVDEKMYARIGSRNDGQMPPDILP